MYNYIAKQEKIHQVIFADLKWMKKSSISAVWYAEDVNTKWEALYFSWLQDLRYSVGQNVLVRSMVPAVLTWDSRRQSGSLSEQISHLVFTALVLAA